LQGDSSLTGIPFVEGPDTVWLLTIKILLIVDLFSSATSSRFFVVSTLPVKYPSFFFAFTTPATW
jgi:hypothetical protein